MVWPLVEDGREALTTQSSAASQRAHDSGTGRQGILPYLEIRRIFREKRRV